MYQANIKDTIRIILLSVCIGAMPCAMASVEKESITDTARISDAIQPLSEQEVRRAIQAMENKLNRRIDAFGQSLSADDFEWTWRGRQLNQKKRREVCAIFQSVVDEFYQMAVTHKARLTDKDQALLKNRRTFIEALGYQNNRVQTSMGFDCLLN